MHLRNVRRLSGCNPRYFRSSASGSWQTISWTGGQVSFLMVKAPTPPFLLPWLYSLSEAEMGLGWEARNAVSLAVIVSLVVGRSEVYRRYSTGPKTLPWGTPELIRCCLVYLLLCVREKTCPASRIKRVGSFGTGGLCFRLQHSALCHTLSKACLTTLASYVIELVLQSRTATF